MLRNLTRRDHVNTLQGRCVLRGPYRNLLIAFCMLGIACLAGPSGHSVEGGSLEPCSLWGVAGDVLCGGYPVFEDRETGAGRTLRLNFVVLKARQGDPEPDPFHFCGRRSGSGGHGLGAICGSGFL